MHVTLSDFVECPGGAVARHLRLAGRQINGVAMLDEWRSEDLGSRAPTDRDFTIAVRADAMIMARKKPPAKDGYRYFDFTKLDASYIGQPELITIDQAAREGLRDEARTAAVASAVSPWRHWLWGIGAGSVLLILSLVAHRRAAQRG
jgi:hypothetical protein